MEQLYLTGKGLKPETQTKRRKRRNSPTQEEREQPWVIYYKAQMVLGKEYCRKCFNYFPHSSQHGWRDRGLQWGHLRPHSKGGKFTVDNITIVCGECNQLMWNWDWTGWVSSLAEEWERISMTVDIDEARRILQKTHNTLSDGDKKKNPNKPLADTVDEMRIEVYNLTSVLADVLKELEDMRANSGKREIKSRDVLTPHATKVLEFLKQYPGISFSTGSLAENIDGLEYKEASSAVGSLFNRDLIKRRNPNTGYQKQRVGAYSYYWVNPAAEILDSVPSDEG